MSNLTTTQEKIDANIMSSVILKGDISQLDPKQKVNYYNSLCNSLGLNPLTQPLGYFKFQGGKETLYAKKDCTEQLRKIHGVSIHKLEKEVQEGLYVVTAYAKDRDGKEDSDMGAVAITGLKGDALVNAMLKAVTKAKRRVTLSICGLGLLDETELETIPKDVTPEIVQEPKSKDILGDYKKQREDADADANEHIVTFGKFKGKKLGSLDPYEVVSYIEYIEKKAKDDGKEITGKVAEFMIHANKWIDSKIERPAVFDGEEELPF